MTDVLPSDARARLRAEFAARGYAVQRGFLAADEVQALADTLRAAAASRAHDDVLDVGGLKFHHALYLRSAPLRAFLASPKVVDLVAAVAGPDFWIRWDQAVEKRPGAGQFPWHQDNSYSGLVDQHFQLWIALTPMTKDNGGLWLAPGVRRRLPHTRDGAHTVCAVDGRATEFVAAEPGDAVLFSSFTPHCTTPNVTDASRWAYVAEFLRWRDVDPFQGPPYFLVAEDGAPAPRFVDAQPAARSLRNRLKYLRATMRGTTWAQRQARGEP